MNRQDDGFEQRARAALDASVTALDADTRRRLAAGRAQAFERKSGLARWLPANNWVPATAFAAIAMLTVTLLVTNRHAESPVQMAQSDPDFALELLLPDDDEDEDAPGAEAGTDFYIRMEAMMLQEEDEQNAG